VRDSGVVGWVLAFAPVAAFVWVVAGTPVAVALGVLVAALFYAGVLTWVAHAVRVRVRAPAAVFALVWGAAVAAPVAAALNDVLQARFSGAEWRLAVAGAPVIEEAAKTGVLLALTMLWSTDLRGVRSGIVIGGIVGLGFGVAENVGYFLLARVQDGPMGLARAVMVRGFLEGAVHPIFTASAGAGIGVATVGRRALPAWVGFGAAVAQHALWNGAASPAVSRILCNGTGPSGACRGDPDVYQLVVLVPLVVAVTLAPGLVGLAVVARRTS
jgi:RsiW-degrading membrane proteinase PrsW (M82 family)